MRTGLRFLLLFTFVLAIPFSSCQAVGMPAQAMAVKKKKPKKPHATLSAEEKTPKAEMERECKSAQKRYFSEGVASLPVAVSVECHEAYHHYVSRFSPETTLVEPEVQPLKDFHIAGFNVYKIGTDEARFKNYDMMAKIMDQWDVVGATEIFPPTEEQFVHNRNIDRFLMAEDNQKSFKAEDVSLEKLKQIHQSYIEPGYVHLLKALQKRDPSWSLIISPEGRGESDAKELSGFFYRSTKAKVVATPYCKQGETENFGCLARVNEEHGLQPSREPFLASFKVGEFDFTVLSAHLRFRAPAPEEVERIRKDFFSPPNCPKCKGKGADDHVSRLGELHVTLQLMNEIRESSTEKDIILIGDFNLNLSDSDKENWNHILEQMPGAKIYVEDPSCLMGGSSGGLGNSYDHFVLDAQTHTVECQAAEGQVFDFTNPTVFPDITELFAGPKLSEAKIQDSRIQYLQNLEPILTIKRGRPFALFPAADREELFDKYENQVISSVKPNDKFKNLLSDHAPIYMKCSAAKDDD